MNTKVKIGIAAAIVAALVALIALDRKTTPSEDTARGIPEPAAPNPATRAEDTETLQLSEKFQKIFRVESPNPQAPTKGGDPSPGKEILTPSPAAPEEYVIQDKDTFAEIARKKYGDPGLWEIIAKANPSVKANNLRPGRKIVIPAIPETPKATPEVNASPTVETSPTAAGPIPSTYEVAPGDTLSAISKKIYNTTRHARAIYEANRELLENPNDLRAGMKLRLPEGLGRQENVVPAVAAPVTSSSAVPAASAPSPGRSHQVSPNESLWKIAEKYCGQRGILEMMQAIIRANPDKLKDEKTTLRVGWNLIIPD